MKNIVKSFIFSLSLSLLSPSFSLANDYDDEIRAHDLISITISEEMDWRYLPGKKVRNFYVHKLGIASTQPCNRKAILSHLEGFGLTELEAKLSLLSLPPNLGYKFVTKAWGEDEIIVKIGKGDRYTKTKELRRRKGNYMHYLKGPHPYAIRSREAPLWGRGTTFADAIRNALHLPETLSQVQREIKRIQAIQNVAPLKSSSKVYALATAAASESSVALEKMIEQIVVDHGHVSSDSNDGFPLGALLCANREGMPPCKDLVTHYADFRRDSEKFWARGSSKGLFEGDLASSEDSSSWDD